MWSTASRNYLLSHRFAPHDSRRSFVSHLLEAGADIATVQKLAGHASVATAARPNALLGDGNLPMLPSAGHHRPMQRIRVFIACSLDGFIAGPNDELDWLGGAEGAEDTFSPFLAQVGSLLMGRRTYDVVTTFDGAWQYGDIPVLVATHRPLNPTRASARSVSGTIEELVDEAKATAQERDVYLDGGQLIRAALDASLIDEITVTVIPIILGAGLPLFAGVTRRHPVTLLSQRSIGGGLVELNYSLQR